MNKETLFDHAVQRLISGEALSEIIKDLPDEMKDLLRVAAEIQAIPEQTSLNLQKQAAHKHKFLAQAVEQKTNSPFSIFLNLVPRLAILFLVIGISLTLTGLASAQSIPGDVLYGVKRTFEQVQLNLTNDSAEKVQLEEVFDARRVREVQKMFASQRRDTVQFAGWLEISVKGRASVEELHLILPSDSTIPLHQLGSSYVEVEGVLQPDGILVKTLQLRLFDLHGELTLGKNQEWLVDGVPFEVSPETRVIGSLAVGKQANITAIHTMDERFLAVLVVVADENGNSNPPPEPTTPKEDLVGKDLRPGLF